MGTYHYLLDIALILISTKIFGIITKRFKLPQVVGALIAGIVLGPAVLNILRETEFLDQLSEIGVIVLMFSAGLEADIHELKKTGKASFIIALFGVIVPLLGGLAIAYIFNKENIIANDASASILLQNIFIGIILTATSVSITVEALKEMKKLNSRAGNAILGAAIIDDILGIVALTIITSLTDESVNIVAVLIKIIAFFVCALVAGFVFYKLMKYLNNRYRRDMRRFVILAFTFCLLMAYAAEEFFGVADITGAFIAGLIISNTERTKYIAERFDVVSYVLLSPVFFASIGLKIVLPKMNVGIVALAIVLTIVAVITKIIGCGFGSKLCGYTSRESVQIGIGMVSRGEVALIVASKGTALGLLSTAMLGPIIIVVVITTIISPILLKIAFREESQQ